MGRSMTTSDYESIINISSKGDGVFIGADGSVRQHPASSRPIELPPEILPSETELERNLDAIVISESKTRMIVNSGYNFVWFRVHGRRYPECFVRG